MLKFDAFRLSILEDHILLLHTSGLYRRTTGKGGGMTEEEADKWRQERKR